MVPISYQHLLYMKMEKKRFVFQLVTPSNILPISEAGPDRVADIGLPIVLDASNSYDPDGNTPLDYQWKMTSQPSGSLIGF